MRRQLAKEGRGRIGMGVREIRGIGDLLLLAGVIFGRSCSLKCMQGCSSAEVLCDCDALEHAVKVLVSPTQLMHVERPVLMLHTF